MQAADADKLRSVLDAGADSYAAWVKGIGKKYKVKGKNMWMPFRLCLTGSLQGAELSPLLACLELENNDVKDRSIYVPLSQRIEILRKWAEAQD